jgi:hypothetical protein
MAADSGVLLWIILVRSSFIRSNLNENRALKNYFSCFSSAAVNPSSAGFLHLFDGVPSIRHNTLYSGGIRGNPGHFAAISLPYKIECTKAANKGRKRWLMQ